MLCDDESTAEVFDYDGDRERRRERTIVVTDHHNHDDIVSQVGPTDLVIVPAHIVRDMAPWRLRKLVGHLRDTNLAVVGGPHRLTISQGVVSRPLSMSISPQLVAD